MSMTMTQAQTPKQTRKQEQGFTLEQAVTIGKSVISAGKAYGQQAELIRWSAEQLASRVEVLKAAIEQAAKIKGKDARKNALAGWTIALKRERQGEKPEKGTQDMRPFLAFTVEGETVKSIEWKAPKPKAEKAEDEKAEGSGEEHGEAAPALTIEAAVAFLRDVLEHGDNAAHIRVQEALEELMALT